MSSARRATLRLTPTTSPTTFVQVTYPSGRIVSYTRDAMGRIAGVATQANSSAVPVAVASGATYAPFGPLTSLSYGNGLSLSVSYDQDYQPSARLVTGASSVQDLSYGVDADGNITGITDHVAPARSQVFQYDSLSRLTYAGGLYGALAYGYDAVGNRTSQSGGSTNLAETYSYAANSNQLLSVANGDTTRSFAYSPTGNIASDNRGSGTALSYTYDLSDRMVQVANQNQPLASYAYNFMGQRVAKSTSSAITQFVYDRAGHLLAENNGATGAAQTEYLWLDDMPLALVTGGNLDFIHADHLNTPQKATDASQNLAWDTVPRPFGQTEQQTFPSVTNMRMPGQYFDVDTGLAQNWFRDYDASIGRYIESDPIGLEGGNNTYAYTFDNPLLWRDPTGLDVKDGYQLCLAPGPGGGLHACDQGFYQCIETAERMHDKGYDKDSHELYLNCRATQRLCYRNENTVQSEPHIKGGTTEFPPEREKNGGGFVTHFKGATPFYTPPSFDPLQGIPDRK
jgi:RHS repeat-associated protein